MMARAAVLKARLKDITAFDADSPTPREGSVTAWTTKKYRCTWSPGGGAAPMKAAWPPSLRSMKAPPGREDPSAPAPVSSEVTSGGRSTRAQCQKPLGVGASGSKQVTVKLRVSAGKPDQESCGEVLPNSAT